MEKASTVFQYCTGPPRQVELLRRTPSTIRRFWRPVKPRMKGEPWPLRGFLNQHAGRELQRVRQGAPGVFPDEIRIDEGGGIGGRAFGLFRAGRGDEQRIKEILGEGG